jgi:hypothetical protein
MVNRTLCTVSAAGLSLLFVGMSVQSSPPGALPGATVVNKAAARSQFLMTNQRTRLAERAGRINRVYGPAFSQGATAAASAESFRLNHAEMFGVPAADLVAVNPVPGADHVLPIMYDQATDTYKFTVFVYTQQRQGVPVFRSALKLLVRNEAGYPLVLASADLRDLGDLQVQAQAAAAPMQPAAVESALQRATQVTFAAGGVPQLAATRRVIFAGVDDMVVAPRLADESMVEINEDRWLIVTDVATGVVLYEERMIYTVDINGTVSGNATEGIGTDVCEAEVLTGLPYVEVSAGGDSATADENGHFTISHNGVDEISVVATITGTYFNIIDAATSVELVFDTITPPGPANIVFNATNTSELIRAQVNGYLGANVVRDFVLQYNPSYPVIQFQQDMTVTVNRVDGFCPSNAWYSSGDPSINFCRANGSAPNTAWTSVIYHEYGHHLVQVGGSGQGAYGEGMGDVTSVLILDDPAIGLGFFGSCNSSLRNADNNCQYSQSSCSSCGSEGHACGNLISGCVWSTRNNLVITEPADYIDILSALAFNSILIHNGSGISPSITVDYLTLDDDDADILNGTPHYTEINNGFSAHGMPGPNLTFVEFGFPSGLPDLTNPGGGTTVQVDVSAVLENPLPGTGKLFVDSGNGFVEIAMSVTGVNSYEAVFPSIPCSTLVSYYFSVDSDGGNAPTSPSNAPLSVYQAISATSGQIAFSDDFESDLGWTVSTTALDGPWQRGVPIPFSICARGNPGADADGSGQCYLTDNSSANGCNSDVDTGATTLTSPIIDATAAESMINYWRWYDNTAGDSPNQDIFVIEVSDNGGSTWTTLEIIGPGGAESNGGWFHVSLLVGDFVNNTSQFRIRFTASDTDPQSVVEAAIDGVMIIVCDQSVFGDLDGDGIVGINDFLQLLGDWGACANPCPPSCVADLDSDCTVGINDFLLLLANWTP